MQLQEALDAISPDGRQSHVYSQPYQTADGATIIAVSKVRGRVRAAGENVGVRAKPVGVFVIRGADVKWEPAVAMIRSPPWPDLRGTIG